LLAIAAQLVACGGAVDGSFDDFDDFDDAPPVEKAKAPKNEEAETDLFGDFGEPPEEDNGGFDDLPEPDEGAELTEGMGTGNHHELDVFRTRTAQEKDNSSAKWNTSKMTTRWQEYRGQMVRVQILLNGGELREMRLKLIQNANGGDVDGDAKYVLDKVADYEMKRVCGRRAETTVVVYDRPSFDTVRPTPFFGYRVDTDGSVMREYGFRCVYPR